MTVRSELPVSPGQILSAGRFSCVVALRIVAGGLMASACSPTQPGGKTTVIPAPGIVCPAPPPSVQTSTQQPVTVTYGAPSVTDGTPPVSTMCAPASGSSFPVGTTTVTCTATDSVRRAARCSFSVVVVFVPPPPPRLSPMRFLAFGDSITQGAVPDGTFSARFRALQLLPPTLSYPGQLEMMLKARYTAQTAQIVVVNRGIQGEKATEGQLRLSRELAANMPDVLLLLEGVNDLNTGTPGSSITALAALRSMIIQANRNNVRVMIGTLLPEKAGGVDAGAFSLIVPFNSQLVPMAMNEGALVVDVYAEFLPNVSDWIGVDGLHPNETGYKALGQVFFNAIKSSFETPGSSTPTRSTPVRTLRR